MNGDMRDVSDADLIRRCREGGDAGAFESLMSRYHERVYGVVARLVNDADRARDLVQETFLKAWRGLPGFEGTSSFYTWLYRIARNLVHSDHRRARARPRVTSSLDGEAEDSMGPVVADSRGDPGLEAVRRERRQMVADAIVRLPPDFREVIVLRDVEKLPYERIAELLEVPVGTVRSRLHRARHELREKLADILTR